MISPLITSVEVLVFITKTSNDWEFSTFILYRSICQSLYEVENYKKNLETNLEILFQNVGIGDFN